MNTNINNTLTPLTAISAVDGRYHDKTAPLNTLFSEYGLIKYRYQIELRWLQTLANYKDIKELTPLTADEQQHIDQLATQFNLETAQNIKTIERTTNHDVKAVEYQLKQDLSQHPSLKQKIEFIHFACTSEDINNLAYALMLKDGRDLILQHLQTLAHDLSQLAHSQSHTPHARPHTWTTCKPHHPRQRTRQRTSSPKPSNPTAPQPTHSWQTQRRCRQFQRTPHRLPAHRLDNPCQNLC